MEALHECPDCAFSHFHLATACSYCSTSPFFLSRIRNLQKSTHFASTGANCDYNSGPSLNPTQHQSPQRTLTFGAKLVHAQSGITMDTAADIHDPFDSDMYGANSEQNAAGTPSSLSNATMGGDGADLTPADEGNEDNGNSKRKRFFKVVEVDAPNNLDLDAYIAAYKGHTKINRLEFIATRCPSLQIDALKLAIAELKATSTLEVGRYMNLVKKLNDAVKFGGPAAANVSPELLTVDRAWADMQMQKVKQQTDLLEGELKNYKRNSIKESIRMGNIELGNHYYACGDLTSAHRCYARTRDYCTTSKHIIELCMNVIKVSIELGNFTHVLTYVVKGESTPEVTQDKELTKAKLKVAAGLSHMDLRKYNQAAREFLTIGEELVSNQYGDVISGNDIAVYGGLCALASFSRPELKRMVIDNVGFRQYLELEPHIRDLIQGFYNSNYAVCLDIMDKWRNDYLLDIHLHSHIEALYTNIRKKALVQFTSPFLTVDLTKMAKSFATTVPVLEQELVSLIVAGQIEARIDSQQKILWAKQTNKRSAIFERSTAMGQEYEKDSKALLLRVQMINHGLVVKGPASEKGVGPHGGPSDGPEDVGGPPFGLRLGGRSSGGRGGGGRGDQLFENTRSNVSNFLSSFGRDRHRS